MGRARTVTPSSSKKSSGEAEQIAQPTCSNEQGALPLLRLDQVGEEPKRITGKWRCHFEGEIGLISVACSQVSANSGKRGIEPRAID